MRDRTDETAAIKREITEGLWAADSFEQYLEPILERISANPELEHSKYTFECSRKDGVKMRLEGRSNQEIA